MDTATATPARPGRQRSEAADQAILSATLDLLALDGYGGLTVASVIAKAGVSSATLYRRWQDKRELVVAALASLHADIVDIDTGAFTSDIVALARSIADAMSVRRNDDLSEAVAQALRSHPDFSEALQEKFVKPRLAVMGRILERARERGELGHGLSATVAMSFVSGPLHHRVYTLGEPITPAFLKAAITGAVAALTAIAPPP